jgi:two-component system OmpR family sensor kinase
VLSRLSLRARLLLGVVALAALGLAAADIATYRSLSDYLIARVDNTLNAVHPSVEQNFFPHEHGGRPDELAPPGYCVQLRTLGGRPLDPTHCEPGPGEAAQSLPRYPRTVSLPAQPNAPEGDRIRFLTVAARTGDGRYRLRVSIEGDHPNSQLFIAAPLRSEDNTLHRLFVIELLVTAIVLAALAAVGMWIVRLGLRPLREIELTAAAITAGDLSQRVDHPDEATEVGRVGSALNAMLDRIETSDRRLRRFIADASHELRTPLAAVRAYAELFGRGAATHPADLERSMSGISREAERMSLLVDDLLLLARLDEGRPLEREPVDLAAVVGDAVDAARVLEPERPIELAVEPVTVTGDATRLRQVLDNLLANVRAHTPAGTPVEVELRRADGAAALIVADHGPGLAEREAARVFERFYRADSSRSRASGGAGLGLSIVAAVTEAHGGSVELRPTPGGGATFVVTLPLGADGIHAASSSGSGAAKA